MTQLLVRPDAQKTQRSTAVPRLDKSWSLALALGWPAATFALLALEPPAHQLTGVAAVIAGGLSLLFELAMGFTVVAAVRRHTLAPRASLAAVGALTAMVISCPLTGHHPHVGAWWYGQFAICAGMLALSRAAFQRHPA